jgi:hypothetical protein
LSLNHRHFVIDKNKGEFRKMAKSKYMKYILKEPKEKEPPIKKTISEIISLNPESTFGLDKIDCTFGFSGQLQPWATADLPHKHNCDELLFFIPGDPKDAPDLGGVVEIAFGEEWEKHVINTPAVICIPQGVLHCPVAITKVDKPFYFGHCLLTSKYEFQE